MLKSSSAKTMAAKSVHPRSFANNSVLAVGYVWKQPDVPVNGSGRPAFDAHLPKTVPWHSPELPKMDLQGVNGVEEARPATSPNPSSNPSLLRSGGGAAKRRYRYA